MWCIVKVKETHNRYNLQDMESYYYHPNSHFPTLLLVHNPQPINQNVLFISPLITANLSKHMPEKKLSKRVKVI